MDNVAQLIALVRRSQMVRLLSVGFLALLLGIPIVMIDQLVGERQQRRDQAIGDVSSKWGSAQTITGPVLLVPITVHLVETTNGQSITRDETRHVVILPSRLHIRGTLDATELARGIFIVPVYKLALSLDGEFAQVRASDLSIAARDIAWDRATLVIGISEVRAIEAQVAVEWNGTPVAFLPGAGGRDEFPTGIHAPVRIDDTTAQYAFSMPIALNGSLAAYFVPTAADTKVEVTSNFRHPNFQGNWLPTTRTVSDAGFSAGWAVPFLGRNYPQTWVSPLSGMRDVIAASRFGVELANPVDPYRMADRSVKYALLFILLTFTSVWLVEVLAGVRVHPIQYLLLGTSLCVFYLLELSLSEHTAFILAYAVAALAVVAMATGYSLAVLRRARRALVVGAGVAGLYGYLYVVLTNEDFALLIGAIGLFVTLGVIMLVTRRVDWYGAGAAVSETHTSSTA